MLITLFCALYAAISVQTGEPQSVDVFPPGMNDVQRYRIPGIVLTPQGTVLAYCEARRNGSADWGEIEIHLRRSEDGGRSWAPAQHVAHHGRRLEGNPRKATGGEHEQTVNNPVVIVDHLSGRLIFLYCINYERCFAMTSADDGRTWSAPADITSAFEPFRSRYDWKVIATGPGHGIQLRNGRMVVPVWLAYGKTGDHAPSAAGTIYSDDGGQTWRAGDIAVPNEGPYGNPNETMAAELSDGRVMLVTRNVSSPNRKLITYSTDGATFWSRPFFDEQLLEPVCMASITAVPGRPGILIFSNPHRVARDADGHEIPGGRGRRENLTIKLSRDDGKTWPVSRTLDAGPSAYSDLAVLRDGTILCLHEAGTSIVCARFSLSWLTGE